MSIDNPRQENQGNHLEALFIDHPVLGRKIRGGSWEDQGISTYQKIYEALGERRWNDAASLAEYFVVEAEVCYLLYDQWIRDLREFLHRQGTTAEQLADAESQIIAVLDLPDGQPWASKASWDDFTSRNELFVSSVGDIDEGQSIDLLEVFVESWRRCHDRHVDFISGLMNQVVTRYGEPTLGDMYDFMLQPWFNARYSQFDVDKHPWAEALNINMMVAFEAMRGHLCGPGRKGDVEFEELEDRYILRFDPCGSGGRTVRGDVIEGTPPRMEAPYRWPVTQEPAAWNHYEPGVCLYCAHCIVLTEILTVDGFGYPVRAVDPPRYAQDGTEAKNLKCSWTMFKDPAAVPEKYFLRIGRKKPARIGSSAMKDT